ncbi:MULTISPECIES: hypothetical protein [Gordonia]|uniref:hypothetical protein n=1 Tax=Gordonia TaxID=2053 RepID=UPI0007EC1E0B|nr:MULTISPECIES: hypothetical protein [Gordonia]OBA42226.1 hypothetical protein A5766_19545 [Gordonia sp. 852002-51296_SCH5728562-b]
MTFSAPTTRINHTAAKTSRNLRLAAATAASMALVPLGVISAPEAVAAPEKTTPQSVAPQSATPQSVAPSDLALPTPGPPMPVPGEAFGYIATHDLTKRMDSMNLPQAVAALPVPDSYRPANLAFAGQFDRAVTAALASPGGCVQVIINSHTSEGNLFDYGFFPIEPKYCP